MTDLLGRKYVPKKGDRVRAVLEGEITNSDDHGYFCIENYNSFDGLANHVVSIEKIPDPLPTTPGSVIQRATDTTYRYALGSDGKWRSLQTSQSYPVWSFATPDYVTLFDAGKAS